MLIFINYFKHKNTSVKLKLIVILTLADKLDIYLNKTTLGDWQL